MQRNTAGMEPESGLCRCTHSGRNAYPKRRPDEPLPCRVSDETSEPEQLPHVSGRNFCSRVPDLAMTAATAARVTLSAIAFQDLLSSQSAIKSFLSREYICSPLHGSHSGVPEQD